MKLTRSFLAFALSFSLISLSFLAIPIHTVTAQENNAALQRGYRTGYSDGYMAGYRDVIDKASKDFATHQEYLDANRAYNKDYGTVEDYRDGYQQGFEAGYDTGFEKRTFDSVVPKTLGKRGIVTAPVAAANPETSSATTPITEPEASSATTPTSEPATVTAVEAVPAPVEPATIQAPPTTESAAVPEQA